MPKITFLCLRNDKANDLKIFPALEKKNDKLA